MSIERIAMDKDYLYLQIAATIRSDITNGRYKPGDSLPSLRSFTETWNCTLGTVQRAFKQLAFEGLLTTHVGKGSKVLGPIPFQPAESLRKANLILQAETFLLDVLASGYDPVEVKDAFRIALDRWRVVSRSQDLANQKTLKFSGSHDLAVASMAAHFGEFAPGYQIHLNFTGSLSGLISLVEGKSDIVGTHLWNDVTESYNTPFIHSLFPGEKLALITLAHRRIGWLVKPGNPKQFQTSHDLTRQDIRFVNRIAGSGTRVYLDSLLKKNAIDSAAIEGYANQKTTHSEIAEAIAEDDADVGLGLEAAAKAYGLDFIFLNLER
ncbi:MAG: GntR family transcriptional regulator, partial [Anaerolineaceae bacterium]|nr:GntR family transcriptional regulator [Anaerolineaceae bacterium]